MIRYAIQRSDGKYMCVFFNKISRDKAEYICSTNYTHCRVVKIDIVNLDE